MSRSSQLCTAHHIRPRLRPGAPSPQGEGLGATAPVQPTNCRHKINDHLRFCRVGPISVFLYCSEAFPFTQPPKSAARFPPGEGIGRRGGQPALARSRRSFRCCHSRDFPPSELKYPGDSAIIGLFWNPLTEIPVAGASEIVPSVNDRLRFDGCCERTRLPLMRELSRSD